MPSVSSLMRPFPYFAEPDTTVAQIIQLMDEHQIRHLPIKQNDRIVGIVSERDLHWLKNPQLDFPITSEIPACHVMIYDPYVAEIDTPLPVVIDEMSRQKIGAAIIVRSGKLAGIVTTIDLCQALSELLKDEFSGVAE
ncbi:CBS domain-containing protein [Waterburya agarophytonicola K14]|uniref:CBS domain-containing protein n=2 Tax=Waterburya TaxID=2886915 RepID=A0A964C0N9_9CYAN|nr:CBS domain-containing protein [Waterburya agarophytonicola KI4]